METINQDWKTDVRKDRHHITQEDFTPPEIVDMLIEGQDDLFNDFSKTFLDPCIGIGFIYIGVLKKRFDHCHTAKDILAAISTMYGTELMDDNVSECKDNIWNEISKFMADNNIKYTGKHGTFRDKVTEILDHNIVCTDTFKWDYENWCPIKEITVNPLF